MHLIFTGMSFKLACVPKTCLIEVEESAAQLDALSRMGMVVCTGPIHAVHHSTAVYCCVLLYLSDCCIIRLICIISFHMYVLRMSFKCTRAPGTKQVLLLWFVVGSTSVYRPQYTLLGICVVLVLCHHTNSIICTFDMHLICTGMSFKLACVPKNMINISIEESAAQFDALSRMGMVVFSPRTETLSLAGCLHLLSATPPAPSAFRPGLAVLCSRPACWATCPWLSKYGHRGCGKRGEGCVLEAWVDARGRQLVP